MNLINILLKMLPDLGKAFLETFEMVGISLSLAIVLGLLLGLFLYITRKGLFLENITLNVLAGIVINIIRSIPFVILLVLLLPLTQFLTKTTIGPIAASVSLSVTAIAFFARLVESALCEVEPGVIEAAVAIGATPLHIIYSVLLSEALPGILRGITVTAISLIGYSAMAGIVGGGGVGDLAIRFGYYRYQTDVMIVTVTLLIVLVQVIQITGENAADKADQK